MNVISFTYMETPILSPIQPISDEKRKTLMIKQVAEQNVLAAAQRYIKTRDRKELEYIQAICDTLDDAFCLMIDQTDGIPVCVTFNPGADIPTLGDDDRSPEVLS